jgi:hypothetical protein
MEEPQMSWLLAALTKIALWIMPQLAALVVDAFGKCLAAVEQAEQIENTAERRLAVMNSLGGYSSIPEAARRFLVEFCVIVYRLGVTAEQLEKMEQLVAYQDTWTAIRESSARRDSVLQQFSELFPNMPERIGRLLLELAVLKVKAAFQTETVQNRTALANEGFEIAKDGTLRALNDGEVIETDRGEILKFDKSSGTWDQIGTTTDQTGAASVQNRTTESPKGVA